MSKLTKKCRAATLLAIRKVKHTWETILVVFLVFIAAAVIVLLFLQDE